jgi:hypothetical protein
MTTNPDQRRSNRAQALAAQARAKRATADLISKAVRDTQERIRGGEGKWNKSDQLRGVRRLTAHLADALLTADPEFDIVGFLTECGYGANGKVAK